MTQYTLITPDKKVIYDDYFKMSFYEEGMIVIDNYNHIYFNGYEWEEIETNHF
jgi:hypothetical protein